MAFPVVCPTFENEYPTAGTINTDDNDTDVVYKESPTLLYAIKLANFTV